MNVSQLITRTRDLLDAGASVGSGPASDADILRAVNDALQWLYGHQIRMDPMALLQVSTLVGLGITESTEIATGLRKITLPEYVARIIRIEDSSYRSLDFTGELDDHGGRGRNVDPGDGYSGMDIPFQAICGNGNDILFRGTTSVSTSLSIWYAHRPPRIAKFTATGGSTSTVELQVNQEGALGELIWRPSYYVGGYVEVTSANNAAPQGDIRRINAYERNSSWPDATMTVDDEFTGTIEEGDTIEMIPQIDPLFHELPCYLAASRMVDRLGNPVQKELLRAHASDLFEQWRSLSAIRQSSQPGRAYRTK